MAKLVARQEQAHHEGSLANPSRRGNCFCTARQIDCKSTAVSLRSRLKAWC